MRMRQGNSAYRSNINNACWNMARIGNFACRSVVMMSQCLLEQFEDGRKGRNNDDSSNNSKK